MDYKPLQHCMKSPVSVNGNTTEGPRKPTEPAPYPSPFRCAWPTITERKRDGIVAETDRTRYDSGPFTVGFRWFPVESIPNRFTYSVQNRGGYTA